MSGLGGALVAGLLLLGAAPPVSTPAAGDEAVRARIASLKAERMRLQEELRASLSDDAKLVGAPRGGVLIGLPTSLVESIVAEAVEGPLRNVRLTLDNVVKLERSDQVTTKTLLGRMTLGRYALTVDVRQVRAVMKPGKAALTFGGNRIALELPVSIEAGDVKAHLSFKWDGKKLAGVVCGDLSVERDMRVSVPPVRVRVRGRFDVEAAGEALLVKPRLSPIDVVFKVEPPKDAWDFLDTLISSRNAVCEAAIRKADVAGKVKALAGRTFKVRVPTDFVRSMTLPAAFRDTFDVKGRHAGLAVTPVGVSITKTRIWYGANVAVKAQPDAARAALSGRAR